MMKDHNQKTEREIFEEQQFFINFNQIKEHRSDMAGIKGEMSGLYGRLKDLGWTKKDVEFAMSLEDKDVAEVIRDFENKLRIARMFGHQLGRQLDLLEADRTPADERAYDEGRAAGMRRATNQNPFGMNTDAGQAWQRGFNDGNELINKELDSAISQAPE